MTEPQPSPHDEQVRRLLADARHDEPIPADVAARLDGVLAGLTTDRGAPPVPPVPPAPPPPAGPPAPVVDLAARRRWRQGAALLVAAAAVVAIGVGVGTVADREADPDSGSAGGTSDTDFDRGAAAEAPEEGDAAPSAAPPAAKGGLARMRPVEISSATFTADAERFRDRAAQADPPPEAAPGSDPDFVCEPTDFGPGTALPVLFDGTEALLVYRPATEDSQVVDVLQCGTADVLLTTTLPVP